MGYSVDGCQDIIRRARAHPLGHHDQFTQTVMRRLGGDIERRANGEPASQALLDEVERLCNTPLDEGFRKPGSLT